MQGNNFIIVTSPVQSPGLQAQNIPPPNHIRMNDINSPNMVGIKRSAEEYKQNIFFKKQSSDTTTVKDIEAAENFRMGAHIASMIPNFVLPIQEAAMEIMTNTIVTRLTEVFNLKFNAIDARFNAIDARLNVIDIRLNGIDTRLNIAEARTFNLTAMHDEDEIRIPEVGVDNTDGFPITLGELKTLPINNNNNNINNNNTHTYIYIYQLL